MREHLSAFLIVSASLVPPLSSDPQAPPAPTARLTAVPVLAFEGPPRAELRWETTGATEVFVSTLGARPSNGSSAVRADMGSHFVLVAEGPGGITTVEADVPFGSKGGDYPDEASFRHLLSFTVRAASYTSLVERIHAILQDSLRHTVSMRQEADHSLRFVTNRREEGDLVAPGETRIGGRRLAYLVALPRPSSVSHEFTFTVQSEIQYRRRIEREWKPETTDSLYESQGRKLSHLIRPGS